MIPVNKKILIYKYPKIIFIFSFSFSLCYSINCSNAVAENYLSDYRNVEIEINENILSFYFQRNNLLLIGYEGLIRSNIVNIKPVFKMSYEVYNGGINGAFKALCDDLKSITSIIDKAKYDEDNHIIELKLHSHIQILRWKGRTVDQDLNLFFEIRPLRTDTDDSLIKRLKSLTSNKITVRKTKSSLESLQYIKSNSLVNSKKKLFLKIDNQIFSFKYFRDEKLYDDISYNLRTPFSIAESIKDDHKTWVLPTEEDLKILYNYLKNEKQVTAEIFNKRIYIAEKTSEERKYFVLYIDDMFNSFKEKIDCNDMAFLLFVSHL